MRILLNLFLIVAFAELYFCEYAKTYNNQKGVYSIGIHESYEELLTEVTLKKRKPSGIGFDEEIYAELIYDPKKSGGNKKITAIDAKPEIDTEFGSKPGKLIFLDGGIGKKNVHLRIESRRGFGIIYKVKIYGKNK